MKDEEEPTWPAERTAIELAFATALAKAQGTPALPLTRLALVIRLTEIYQEDSHATESV